MVREIVYGTINPGKIWEVGKHLQLQGISVISLAELEITANPREDGASLEENAALKADVYRKFVPDKLLITDDTGLEIDALNGEPGIHVRRWRDGKNRMNDEDMIKYCLERMVNVPYEQRGAQFRTVITLAIPGQPSYEYFEGVLRGIIQEQPADFRQEGFPFESLFFVPDWQMLLGEAHRLPQEEKDKYLSHRERAVQNAVPRIQELLQ